MNFEKWEYYRLPRPRGHVELAVFCEDIRKKFRDEMDNPKYNSFFQDCHPNTIGHFKDYYAGHKLNFVLNSDYIIRDVEKVQELRFRDQTEEMLNLILQKKLFNLQLLWRAEKINIPQVYCSTHFHFWGNHIRQCPFLDDITEQEITVMKRFLQDPNFVDTTPFWLNGWQDYEDFMKKDQEDNYYMMPEWYEFSDGMMGTGSYLLLPNTRGDKEEVYRTLNKEEFLAKQEAKHKVTPPPPHVHYKTLNTDAECFYDFAFQYEDEYFEALFEHENTKAELKSSKENDFDVMEYVYLLEDADRPVYMNTGGCTWKEAIMRCAIQYQNECVADELDLVVEEFNMLRQSGVETIIHDFEEAYGNDDLIKMVTEQILHGRELAGEPRNFDFINS